MEASVHHLVYLARTPRGTIEVRRSSTPGAPALAPRNLPAAGETVARGEAIEAALLLIRRRLERTDTQASLLQAIGRRLVARASDDRVDDDGLPIISASVAAILGDGDPEACLELPSWLDAPEDDTFPIELASLVDLMEVSRQTAIQQDVALIAALRRLALHAAPPD